MAIWDEFEFATGRGFLSVKKSASDKTAATGFAEPAAVISDDFAAADGDDRHTF